VSNPSAKVIPNPVAASGRAGPVICRQRPGTAKEFVFIGSEDETGISNAIVSLVTTQETFLLVESVIHIRAEQAITCRGTR
jgi:error-prone DNA polymerase